ncbi:MAG: hypothetical protein CMM01_22370 [Rhodopirellula sp.]|nr:hypothetical protein [Rhodopirellula sp.]OUX49377.1 MAG: hypothetical protein CBE43_10105 [Rhodopirellula sp. TMED283]
MKAGLEMSRCIGRSLRFNLSLLLLTLAFLPGHCSVLAGQFEQTIQPLIAEHCVHCHEGSDANGEMDFAAVETRADLIDRPEVILAMLKAIDSYDMPPQDEPELDEPVRQKAVVALKALLRESTSVMLVPEIPMRRLNRFQYNYAVKDLFGLKMDVFHLPEKMMSRDQNYVAARKQEMPTEVRVSSKSLDDSGGMTSVNSFPKDLRASHGFDNQANQLTLSPLLLDAFLRLSVSITDSPDFNEKTVGVWNEFFAEPAEGGDLKSEIQKRLKTFLRIAFRGPVEIGTLTRYRNYAFANIESGLSFTQSMKKVAAAALSSPLFLYRADTGQLSDANFELASRLSFFLWGSGPDEALLRLAEQGQLTRPEVLANVVDRMMSDPKIERFLDSFPAQWMQLENVLAATPDPRQYRLFSLDQQNPASLQMLLEPLLLFDMVFLENRPLADLLLPKLAYRSEFLNFWYTSDLKAPRLNREEVDEFNRRNEQRRNELAERALDLRNQKEGLVAPVRERLLKKRRQNLDSQPPLDLKPYAAWEFDGDLKSSVNDLDLTPHGEVRFEDGLVVLDRAYLQSPALPIDLKMKSLEVTFRLHDVNQQGGGVMGIQGPGDFFDTIVLGERKPQHWISGSNGFSRTDDFPDSTEETETEELLHLVMVYQEDGNTQLYRNGQPYGGPFNKGLATFPKEKTSVIFGLRHLPAGGNKYLSISIDQARLYDRELKPEEVLAAFSGNNLFVSDQDIRVAMSDAQNQQFDRLTDEIQTNDLAIEKIPGRIDPAKRQQDLNREFDGQVKRMLRSRVFERVTIDDPRYGGVVTNAAMMSMTSGPKRTHPIARGAWVIEVIFNDPPAPPPNDVPPLNEEQTDKNLTIREKFAIHRENPDCASCHARLDPLGFALENFDITGRWRDKYSNGRPVDAAGTLMTKYAFDDVVRFKKLLHRERHRFANAFTAHLLRFALARDLGPADAVAVDEIVEAAGENDFPLRNLIREVVLHQSFVQGGAKTRGTD